MGLDMYLTKKTYVGAEHEHRKVTGVVDIKVNDEALPIDFKRISNIEESLGYWRKANHIHNWFVENVQHGEDDCKEYYVDDSQLEELLNTCIKVRDSLISSKKDTESVKVGFGPDGDIMEDISIFTDTSVAEELLPTSSGFFFGGTQYDEYYLDKIEYTIELIQSILKDRNEKGYLPYDVYYQSSW